MTIDFEFNEEQKMLQNSVADFARKELTKEISLDCERRHEFPWELYRKFCAQDYVGVNWPVEFGGQGLGLAEKMIVAYEIIKAEPNLGATFCGAVFGADMIYYNGTDEQKKKWMPRIATGEVTTGGCFTEPNGGSDLARVLDTRAVKSGNHWTINGTKCFISNSTTASVFVVLAQTNPEAVPPYRGQTDFLVERGQGLESSLHKGKMGYFASPTGEVVFNDVRVSEDDILGGAKNENRGIYMTMGFLDEGRLYIGFRSIALAEAALARAVEYAKERRAFGRPIAGFQGLAYRLVDMSATVEAVKALCFKGLWIREKAKRDRSLTDESMKLNSVVKCLAARAAVESCDLAVDVLGGSGYFSEEDVSRWYTLAKHLELIEGTKEIQKNAIARVMFGSDIIKTF